MVKNYCLNKKKVNSNTCLEKKRETPLEERHKKQLRAERQSTSDIAEIHADQQANENYFSKVEFEYPNREVKIEQTA